MKHVLPQLIAPSKKLRSHSRFVSKFPLPYSQMGKRRCERARRYAVTVFDRRPVGSRGENKGACQNPQPRFQASHFLWASLLLWRNAWKPWENRVQVPCTDVLGPLLTPQKPSGGTKGPLNAQPQCPSASTDGTWGQTKVFGGTSSALRRKETISLETTSILRPVLGVESQIPFLVRYFNP